MYKFDRYHQYSLSDFNQPMGMEMNPENRWVKKASMIPWDEIEDRYAELFPSEVGMPAKPLQTALGSLLIQKEYGYSDRELVEQIKENPYYQYFIGLPGYEYKAPFVPSLLVEFRKRLDEDVLAEINEIIAAYNSSDDSSDDDPDDGGNSADNASNENNTVVASEPKNKGTLILDATCAPQNIAFPQDINLLNEARENLESMIDQICDGYNFYKPRMYRKKAREAYLALAKCRRRTGHYPERVLVDQIYRNQKNRAYCKSKKIRISGKALGRPKKPTPEEKKTAHQDNTDRIEVERGFSLAKRCFGMELITTKLDITIRSSIALSILAMNLSNLARAFLLAIFYPIFLLRLQYNEQF